MSQQSHMPPSSPVLPKRSNRNLAMLLIVAGGIILLYNSGALGSILFSTLMPIVLIAFGFDLLTEGTQRRRAATGALLAAVVLTPLMSVAHFMEPERPRPPVRSPRQAGIGTVAEIDRVRAHIELTTGELSIGRLSEESDAVVALDSARGQEYTFRTDNRTGMFNIDRPLAGDNVDLKLTQNVPVDLEIEMGNGNAAPLDFEDIKLEKLDLTHGSGNTELTLPEQGVMEVTITRTTGQLELNIPDELEARIEVDKQLSKIEVDDRFQFQDGAYVTEDYSDEAENRATIRINMTYGNIIIN